MPDAQPGATSSQSGLPAGTAEESSKPTLRAGGQEEAQPTGPAPTTDHGQQEGIPPWLQAQLDAEDEPVAYHGDFYDMDTTDIPATLDSTSVQNKGRRRRRGADQPSRK